ncbi:MAG: hypothetical protein JXR71_10100 [Bacteroidales bacterium]|nr:hypothetical protein [Bacteroidales bacterium]
MKTAFLLIFSFILLGAEVPEKTNSTWKKVKDSDGIVVYTQTSDSTDLKRVKVLTEARAPLSSMVALIKDVKNQKNWFYMYKGGEILKVFGPKHWIFYGQANAPWPVTDRDFVTDVVLHQCPETKVVTITSHSLPDYYPKQKDFVRVPYAYSQWTFTPQKDGNVKISLIVEINAGGHIPLWVMNITATKGPFHTMKNFLAELKKEKFARISDSCISEP